MAILNDLQNYFATNTTEAASYPDFFGGSLTRVGPNSAQFISPTGQLVPWNQGQNPANLDNPWLQGVLNQPSTVPGGGLIGSPENRGTFDPSTPLPVDPYAGGPFFPTLGGGGFGPIPEPQPTVRTGGIPSIRQPEAQPSTPTSTQIPADFPAPTPPSGGIDDLISGKQSVYEFLNDRNLSDLPNFITPAQAPNPNAVGPINPIDDGSTNVNINTPTPTSQLNTFEVPTDVFPTSTSQSTNFSESGSSGLGQSSSGSESGGFSTGRSFSGIDFNNPIVQGILPDLIGSAQGLRTRTDELGQSLNDMFANQMRRAFAPQNFQGIINSLSNRNVLNSDVASDTLAKAGNIAAKTIADKGFEAQVAQSQNQLALPGIFGNLANLGQTSRSATDAGNRASSFSDAFNLSDAFGKSGGESSSFQADPSKPFDIMSRLLTF